MAYCVKEKAQKPMKDAHEVILKNGKHAMQGVCSSCGTKMMKFISSKKPAAESASGTAAPDATGQGSSESKSETHPPTGHSSTSA
jgi:predicted  nucleic acid-binding Zn-ribbon protein